MISNVSSNKFASPLTSHSSTNKSTTPFSLPQDASRVTTPQTESSRVSLSTTATAPQAQLQDLAKRYDVTNMSDRQMGQFAGELRESGLISEREFFDMTLVIKPPGGNYNPDAPKNFLTQYQTQTEHAKLYSTAQDSKMLEHLSSLLLSMQQARNSALG